MTSRMINGILLSTLFALTLAPHAQAAQGRYPNAAGSAPARTTTTATTTSIDASVAPVSNVSNAGARRSPLNWDAFIDAQAMFASKEYVPDKGFTVNDAALYISKDFSRASAIVDLPFYSTSAAGSNQFVFAQQKAQAYVQTNFGAFGVRLGQYDSFFGLEANDSIARFFADQGLQKGLGVVPLTHTGVQGIFSANRFTLRGQVANANSAGNMVGGDPEVGVQARFDMNNAYGAAGIEYGTYRNNVDDNKTNLLIQLMGGLVVNKFNLGAELNFRKLSGISAGTGGLGGAPAAAGDKTGFGLGVLGAFEINDLWSIGGRLDFVKDINVALATSRFGALTGVVDNGFMLSVGPSYKLEQDLTLRGDLSVANLKGLPGRDDTVLGVTLSLVARL